jgi:hypothetical protein
MFTEQQIEQNLNAMENAVAQQTLEGLTVSEDVVANLRKAAYGEKSLIDCYRLELGKYQHAKIRRKRSLSV